MFLTLKLLPALIQNVVDVGLSSHGVLPCIASRATKQHDLRLAHDSDRVPEAGLRHFTVDFNSFDDGSHINGCTGPRWIVLCPLEGLSVILRIIGCHDHVPFT